VTLGAADRHLNALAVRGIASRIRGLIVRAASAGDTSRREQHCQA
jgi:hypothetical protein